MNQPDTSLPHVADIHTHNLDAPAGNAIICLPLEWTERPERFRPRPGALYSAGIHPWWTADEAQAQRAAEGLARLLPHPQIVAVGECGFDRLRGGTIDVQTRFYLLQAHLALRHGLPLIIHCVRAFDVLLHVHRQLSRPIPAVIHGFRGRPALARQLLDAGFDLSFGSHYNPQSWEITPPARRHCETDDEAAALPTPQKRHTDGTENSCKTD